MSVPNDELEKIIDNLNDNNKIVAKSFLSWLLENQLSEDEQLSEHDLLSIVKAREELKNGDTTTLEDLKRELGL